MSRSRQGGALISAGGPARAREMRESLRARESEGATREQAYKTNKGESATPSLSLGASLFALRPRALVAFTQTSSSRSLLHASGS